MFFILISLVEDLNSGQSQFAKALQVSAGAAGALDSKNQKLNQTFFISDRTRAGRASRTPGSAQGRRARGAGALWRSPRRTVRGRSGGGSGGDSSGGRNNCGIFF